MTGRFDFDGAIVAGGTAIQVSGPVRWEDDEAGAVIHATLTMQPGVRAIGDSVFTPRTSSTWFATLTVVEGTVHNGKADAVGSATVTLTNGDTEEYEPWPDKVVLHGG